MNKEEHGNGWWCKAPLGSTSFTFIFYLFETHVIIKRILNPFLAHIEMVFGCCVVVVRRKTCDVWINCTYWSRCYRKRYRAPQLSTKVMPCHHKWRSHLDPGTRNNPKWLNKQQCCRIMLECMHRTWSEIGNFRFALIEIQKWRTVWNLPHRRDSGQLAKQNCTPRIPLLRI